jgi:hypothetical protein
VTRETYSPTLFPSVLRISSYCFPCMYASESSHLYEIFKLSLDSLCSSFLCSSLRVSAFTKK